MARWYFVLASLLLSICISGYSDGIDTFLEHFTSGNVHTLLFRNPLDFIEMTGEEPAKYDYYSGKQYIFTYVSKPESSSPVQAISIIWSIPYIEEIRLSFAKPVTIDEILQLLGYTEAFFDTQTNSTIRLGYIPYRVRKYTAKNAVRGNLGLSRDVIFLFLLNHFDDTVHMLIIQHK